MRRGLWTMRRGLSTKKGVVLLSVVILLLTIALIGGSLVAFFSSVNITVRSIADEARALYLAEAGIAQAVYLLRTHAGAGGQLKTTIGPLSLAEGSYTVKLDFGQALITSTGVVRGIKKTVQVHYEPF